MAETMNQADPNLQNRRVLLILLGVLLTLIVITVITVLVKN
jgi:hypothetical protein